ncbi:MAG: polyprenyl synthetase family protein [Candidatus Omnitrophica bacterium]|nr:polyprenyl synthetase family protein [Candidatus Omnitrophota bacterium]
MTLEKYFKEKKVIVDKALDSYLPEAKAYPSVIHQAMRYAVLNGGKRFRPILAIAATEALGGTIKDVLPAACALELIHSYSLIHDDLPCMDNDMFRRGKPTVHKKFGEAIAVLAGDALLTQAFHVLASMKNSKLIQRLVPEIAHAVGSHGMIGGQVVDKQISLVKRPQLPEISYVNISKTGQLIRVSCLTGAIAAGADKKTEKTISDYGECLGFSYQIVDDIIDSDGFVRIMSRHEAQDEARVLTERAKKSVKILGSKANRLGEIADFVLNREG